MSDDQSENGLTQVGRQFRDLGVALTRADGTGLDPELVVAFAARALPHTHHCGLTLLRGHHAPRTVAATDELAQRVDDLQYARGEGPCLDASEGDPIVLSGDLGSDERWPTFGPECAGEIGVRSMLSIRLALGGDDRAALNFYARSVDAFAEADVQLASVLAPFAALAVEQTLRARDAENLHTALTTSRQIGTAIGILMARHLVTSAQAFELLREASQKLNRKLRDIAAEVTETGSLPTPSGSAEQPATDTQVTGPDETPRARPQPGVSRHRG